MDASSPALSISAVVLGTGNQTFKDAMKVRTAVFVEEQGVPAEIELDSDEPRCFHLVIYSGSTPVGAARIVCPLHPHHDEGPEKEPGGNYIKMGRLATLKEWRGKGVGRMLVDAAMDFAKDFPEAVGPRNEGGERIEGEWDGRVLARAQVVVKRAWEKMGFVEDPSMGEWVEGGIVHCAMWRNIEI